MGDLSCHVLAVSGIPGAALLVSHDCAGTRGTSGAPLLTPQNGGWAVAAINIAAGPNANLALSPPPDLLQAAGVQAAKP
jgi:protease YdgD